MPKLGLTMTEGTITEWVAGAGEKVSKGSVVMTIETDKVEEEVSAEDDGIVFHTAEAGETLEPGEIAGWLLAEGEAPPDGSAPPAPVEETPPAPVEETPPAPVEEIQKEEMDIEPVKDIQPPEPQPQTSEQSNDEGRILSSPNARRVAAAQGVDLSAVQGTGPGGRITSEDVTAHEAVPAVIVPSEPDTQLEVLPAGQARLVPFAARMAAERLGVNVEQITGTGPEGRVSREDVYNFARSSGMKAISSPTSESQGVAGERIPMKGMRGIIAERMYTSLHEMAQLTLTMDVDMDRAIALREQLKDIGTEEIGAVPGYTDFVIAAVAQALRQHPRANSQVDGNDIVLLDQINVGMAVAVPDGLVVPVVHGTDYLGLTEIAQETSRLATAAREKKLTLAEMEGGTFSVTALGMFGVDAFTPVINPPNAGILGVGRIRDDVAWEGDLPVRVKRMTISLTWDHRVIDGAPAAEFAASIKNLLEQPLRLLG